MAMAYLSHIWYGIAIPKWPFLMLYTIIFAHFWLSTPKDSLQKIPCIIDKMKEKKICENCLDEFTPTGRNQKYCGSPFLPTTCSGINALNLYVKHHKKV